MSFNRLIGCLYKSVFRANRSVACSLTPRLSLRYVSSFAVRLLALHPAKRISSDILGCLYKSVFRANRSVACSLTPRLSLRYVSSFAVRLLALHPAKRISSDILPEKIGVELPAFDRFAVYQFLQPGDEFIARDLARAERGEVRGVHLAVDHAEPPASELPGEMRQRDLRGVAGPAEHGFAVEHAADGDAVQSPNQPAVHPGLHRVRVTHLVQRAIGRDHVFTYPCAVMPAARRGAGAHHLPEGGVTAHFISGVAQHLGERAGDPDLARDQHHARVGAPPQGRLAGIEPREDAVPVGLQQARRGQVAARREQAVGRAQRALDRGEGRITGQPGDQVSVLSAYIRRTYFVILPQVKAIDSQGEKRCYRTYSAGSPIIPWRISGLRRHYWTTCRRMTPINRSWSCPSGWSRWRTMPISGWNTSSPWCACSTRPHSPMRGSWRAIILRRR